MYETVNLQFRNVWYQNCTIAHPSGKDRSSVKCKDNSYSYLLLYLIRLTINSVNSVTTSIDLFSLDQCASARPKLTLDVDCA